MAKPDKKSSRKPKSKPTPKKKPLPKKNPAKTKPSKPAKPAKKISAGKKPTAKKHDAKPAVKKAAAAKAKKPTVKKEPKQKKPSAKKTAVAQAAKPVPGAPRTSAAKEKNGSRDPAGKGRDETQAGDTKRDKLRSRILKDHNKVNKPKPVAFTLTEALEVAKQHAATAGKTDESASAKNTVQSKATAAKLAKAAAPIHVKAASLADILGFNPKKTKPTIFAPVESVPEKYRRYYKLLLDLRGSLTDGLTLHTEQTLRRSTKDDAGDLSSYGQHMADAGTDTFDRDFALSMVANEQEALAEIDAAIKRIQNNTYGICEITQKPIAKDRLLAVPFTRYSAEAQKDLERNRMRVRTAAGLFGGEIGDEGSRVDDSGGGEGE